MPKVPLCHLLIPPPLATPPGLSTDPAAEPGPSPRPHQAWLRTVQMCRGVRDRTEEEDPHAHPKWEGNSWGERSGVSQTSLPVGDTSSHRDSGC